MTAKKTPDVAKAPPKPASVNAKVPLKTTAKPKSAAPPKKGYDSQKPTEAQAQEKPEKPRPPLHSRHD